MSMYCQNCGAEIDTRYPFPDGSVQCPQCGMIYRPANYQPMQPQYQQPQFQPTNSQDAQPGRQPRRRRADMYGDQQDAPQEPVQPQYQQPTGQQFRQSPTPTYQQPVQQQLAPVQHIQHNEEKVKKSPLGKIIIAVAAILVVVILAVVLLGNRSPYAKQYALITKFEKAYNNQDFYAMVECFEPQAKQLLSGLVSLSGANGGAMMDILPYVSKALGASGAMSGSYGKVKFTPYNCTVNGTDAVVAYHVEHTLNGNTQKYDEAAQLVQVNGEWYFSTVQADQDTLMSQVGEERPPAHLEQSEDMFDNNVEEMLSESVTFDEAKELGGFYYPLDNGQYLLLNTQAYYKLCDHISKNLILFNEYDFPTLDRSTKIMYFSGKNSTSVGNLTASVVEYNGYTTQIYLDKEHNHYWDFMKEYTDTGKMTGNFLLHPNHTSDSIIVNGYPKINDGKYTRDDFIDGLLHVEQGTPISMSWFEGTNYVEKTYTADYHFLQYTNSKNVPHELTKNGYAEYDLRVLTPGTYVFSDGSDVLGAFRVKGAIKNPDIIPIIEDSQDILTEEEETRISAAIEKIGDYNIIPAVSIVTREKARDVSAKDIAKKSIANKWQYDQYTQYIYVCIIANENDIGTYSSYIVRTLVPEEKGDEITQMVMSKSTSNDYVGIVENTFNDIYEVLQNW